MVLAYLVYVSLRCLTDSEYWTFFAGVTLAVHEAGHVIFSALGEMPEVMGGSIMQVAVPLIVAWLFLRQREYFGISIALLWLSMSLANLAAYIGDARTQYLSLVSLGSGDPIHDWHFILGRYGMLGDDHAIARFTMFLAGASLVLGAAWGLWLYNAMRQSAGTVPPADEPHAGAELAPPL